MTAIPSALQIQQEYNKLVNAYKELQGGTWPGPNHTSPILVTFIPIIRVSRRSSPSLPLVPPQLSVNGTRSACPASFLGFRLVMREFDRYAGVCASYLIISPRYATDGPG